MKTTYKRQFPYWQSLLCLPLILSGCTTPTGTLVSNTALGGTVGAAKSIIQTGKVDPIDVASHGFTALGSTYLANQAAEKREAEAFVTGTEIGNKESSKNSYDLVQNVHKAQEDKDSEKLQTKLYPVQAPLPANSNVKQVPHEVVVTIKEPAK